MSNEVMLLGGQNAVVEAKRMNYEITAPNGVKATLKRDVDFGVIPKTKKPSLYKSGAEKICFAYGLMQRYHIDLDLVRLDFTPSFPVVDCQKYESSSSSVIERLTTFWHRSIKILHALS